MDAFSTRPAPGSAFRARVPVCPERSASGSCRGTIGPGAICARCRTRLQNTHEPVVREVLYPLHPWAGREVFVHVVIERAGVHFHCTLDGSAARRRLEIPAWMFDRAACANGVEHSATPFVSLAALNALSSLLDRASKIATSSPDSIPVGACQASHDLDRREASGTADGSEGQWRQAAACCSSR